MQKSIEVDGEDKVNEAYGVDEVNGVYEVNESKGDYFTTVQWQKLNKVDSK